MVLEETRNARTPRPAAKELTTLEPFISVRGMRLRLRQNVMCTRDRWADTPQLRNKTWPDDARMCLSQLGFSRDQRNNTSDKFGAQTPPTGPLVPVRNNTAG